MTSKFEGKTIKNSKKMNLFNDFDFSQNSRTQSESEDGISSATQSIPDDPFLNALNNSQYDRLTDTKFSQSQASQQTSQFTLTQVFADNPPEPTFISSPKKQTKFKSPGKQRSIFDFAIDTNTQPKHPDPFYATVENIYIFFNRERPIPVILEAIHQSAGNISNAMQILRNKKSIKKFSEIDFRFQAIKATSDQIEEYFS